MAYGDVTELGDLVWMTVRNYAGALQAGDRVKVVWSRQEFLRNDIPVAVLLPEGERGHPVTRIDNTDCIVVLLHGKYKQILEDGREIYHDEPTTEDEENGIRR